MHERTRMSKSAPSGTRSRQARGQTARAQTIRLFELAFALMSALVPLTREQLMQVVTEYREAPDGAARDRMFERDKETLRNLGMKLRTDLSTEDSRETYQLLDRDFTLPEIEFTVEERAMLALAGRVWNEQAMASSSQETLATLAAAGVELDDAPTMAFQPSLSAGGEGLPVLWQANAERRRVRFSYRSRTGEVTERVVEPWLIGFRSGNCYLVGWDLGREDRRAFKLARLVGLPVAEGPADAYEPPTVDSDEILRSLAPATGEEEAVVAIRHGRAPGLRRFAEAVEHPWTPPGHVAVRVRYSSPRELAQLLAVHGADVLVLEPAKARQAVVDHLRRVVEAHAHDAGEGEG